MEQKYRLLIFDMDGTLVEQKSSWSWLHRYFGSLRQEGELLELYKRGEINYEEFMMHDIASWPNPVHITEVAWALSFCRLRPGARKVVDKIRSMGIGVALVTAGLDLLAARVARTLGIEHYLSNSLEVDSHGYLTGRGIQRVEPKRKDVAAIHLASRLGFKLDETVGVADHELDLSFLKAVGLGIAFNNPALAREARLPLVTTLDEIPSLLK